MRQAADQVAIRLLLLLQALFARDLELAVDVPEFEQQRGFRRVDRGNRAREVQLRMAGDGELELLPGVRRAGRARALDRHGKRDCRLEYVGEHMPDEFLPRQLEQILGSRIRVDDASARIEQQYGGGEQVEIAHRQRGGCWRRRAQLHGRGHATPASG